MTFYRPAWIDSLGPYNLSPADCGDPDDPPEPEFFADFVNTIPSPPRFVLGEINAMESTVKTYLGSIVQGTSYGRRAWMLDTAGDRTLRIAFKPAGAFTSKIAHYFQDLLRDRFPIWRIAVLAEAAEDGIVIYPDAVVVGRSLYRTNWEAKLEEAIAAEDARNRFKDRYLREQIALVERHIRSSPPPCDPRYRVVAVFDNYNGDKSRYSIWIVTSGEHDPAIAVLDGTDTWNGFVREFDADGNWTDWTDPMRPRPVGYASVKLAPKVARVFRFGLRVPREKTIEQEFVVDIDDSGVIVQDL